jgi:hypothetical protein
MLMFWLNIAAVVMQAIQLAIQAVQFILEYRKQK